VPAPAALVEQIPGYHLQAVASRIHRLPLLLLLEMGQHTDPVGNQMLQKWLFVRFVKDKVIPSISNCPNKRTHSYADLNKALLRNTLEPIPKKISNILMCFKPKSHIDNTPN
jgi:hypothetical protein